MTVAAASERQAAEKLLVIASAYGQTDRQGLYEFGEHYQLDLATFDLAALPEVDWQAFSAEYFRDPGFTPNTDPRIAVSEHTDGAVDRARDRLAGQFQHDPAQQSVICPYCSKEFFVDR